MTEPTLIGVIDDVRFDGHRAAGDHPERPERLEAARSGLSKGIPAELQVAIPFEPASMEALGRVHSPTYLGGLDRALVGWGHLDPDTFFCPDTRPAAFGAAGAAIALSDFVLGAEPRRGLALLRPPGHHACPERAMGFCMLNNIAIAAAHALHHGAKRVAIVDWDVHHGNGTQDAFAEDPRVLFVSMHQYPFYPGTGAAHEVGRGAGLGATANVPFSSGAGPEDYAHAFRQVVLPLLDEFQPDVVLVSAGFDAHGRDPLAGMSLDSASFGAFTRALIDAGHERLGLFLEGGYDLTALEDSIAEVGRALLGGSFALSEDTPSSRGAQAVEQTLQALKPYWTLPERS